MTDVEDLRLLLINALIDRDKRVRHIKSEIYEKAHYGYPGNTILANRLRARSRKIAYEFDRDFEIVRKDKVK